MAGENVTVFHEQDGSKLTIGSGGTIEVQSGGVIDVKAGGVIKAAGTQASAITALTDSSGGSADDTIAAIGTLQSPRIMLAFTGKNGSGACTLTGSAVGDVVLGIVNITDGTTATSSFESTITVVNQIQQSSASDLSTKKFAVLLANAADATVKNAFADCAAKINAIIAAIKGAGIIP